MWWGMKSTDRNPMTETDPKISILDSKINMFLILFILGVYYEVLNKYYPRGKFISDLIIFLDSDLSFQGV